MTRDELEYAISQYIDGTLPPLETSALEERLAVDAEARAILAEYRQLNTILKNSPTPSIAWDRLAGQIQQAVAKEEAPQRHYKIFAMGWTARMAIAASVLFAVSVTMFFMKHEQPVSSSSVIVVGPPAEQFSGQAIAEISVGPSPTVAGNWQASQEVQPRSTVVVIDRADDSGQDSESTPY